jgi:magnesium chelatase subunit I
MPLDILFIFTANPEDYTNRGSIVTPLKDRIESQIITHYPKTIEISEAITAQEADILPEQSSAISVDAICRQLIEQIAMEARKSEFVDQKSGVSARLTIAAYENLVSTAERRMLQIGETHTHVRIIDFLGVIPAITGKIELVYEGEQEGSLNVAYRLLSLAMRTIFCNYFPDPNSIKSGQKGQKQPKKSPYQPIIDWFGQGNDLLMLASENNETYRNELYKIDGLYAAVMQYYPDGNDDITALRMELLLHGLAEFSLISKQGISGGGYTFSDILGSMMNFNLSDEEEED